MPDEQGQRRTTRALDGVQLKYDAIGDGAPLGLALAPALTCCLPLRGQRQPRTPTAGIERAPELSRVIAAGAPLSRRNLPHATATTSQKTHNHAQRPSHTKSRNLLILTENLQIRQLLPREQTKGNR